MKVFGAEVSFDDIAEFVKFMANVSRESEQGKVLAKKADELQRWMNECPIRNDIINIIKPKEVIDLRGASLEGLCEPVKEPLYEVNHRLDRDSGRYTGSRILLGLGDDEVTDVVREDGEDGNTVVNILFVSGEDVDTPLPYKANKLSYSVTDDNVLEIEVTTKEK